MRQLTLEQVSTISAGTIKPSHWVPFIAAGMLIGTSCCVLTAFSAAPVAFSTAISVGGIAGGGLAAAYEVLHEYNL